MRAVTCARHTSDQQRAASMEDQARLYSAEWRGLAQDGIGRRFNFGQVWTDHQPVFPRPSISASNSEGADVETERKKPALIQSHRNF